MRHVDDGRPDMPAPTQTALIVPVPELERLVAPERQELDVAATWGVPAHVTVVYPFAPPDVVDAALLRRLRAAVAAVPAFACAFRTTGWFGDEVVFVRPDPDQPFRALTQAVWAAFPQWPPYGGVHADVVPHLTVGEARRARVGRLRAAEATVRAGLPLSAGVSHVWLVQGTTAADSWRLVQQLPLGRPRERSSPPQQR